MTKYVANAAVTIETAQAQGTTIYRAVAGRIDYQTDESVTQFKVDDTLTLRNALVKVFANSLSGSAMVTFRKNGADGNLTMSVPSSATGIFEDTTHTDSLSAGDLVAWKTVAAAGTGTIQFNVFAVTIEHANASVGWFFNSGASRSYGSATPSYFTLNGYPYDTAAAPSRPESQYKFKFSAVLKKLRVYVNVNTANGTRYVRLEKNGANGNQVCTIPASTTGWFQDTANTDSVASGDLVNTTLTTGGTSGSTSVFSMGYTMTNSGSDEFILAAQHCFGIAQAFSITRYHPVTGRASPSSNETNYDFKLRLLGTIKNLQVTARYSTLNGTTVVTFRKAGANGNLTLSIPASTSGLFEDTVHTDTILMIDAVDFSVVTAGSSGSVYLSTVAVTGLNLVGGADIIKAFAEDIHIEEASEKVLGFIKSIAEALEIEEAKNSAMGLDRILIETVQIQDASTVARILTRIWSEALSMLEQKLRSIICNRVRNESLFLSESVSQWKAKRKTRNEAVNIGETRIQIHGLVESVIETLQFIEGKLHRGVIRKLLNESIWIFETRIRTRIMRRIRNETTQFLEALVKFPGLIREKAEALEISELGLSLRGRLQVIGEAIHLEEARNKIRTLRRIRNETLNFIEVSIRSRILVRIASEIAELSEATERFFEFVQIKTEALEISEAKLALRGLVQLISETIHLAEMRIASRQMLRSINETIRILERLAPEIAMRVRVRISTSARSIKISVAKRKTGISTRRRKTRISTE